ncbi:hypothetical protein D8771_11655 [Streptomyces albus]|uniref:Uncharacterized protein n=1 Tax=Streptomyces albus TaxID=1888 RepID=A0A8H1LJB5_9ACTN|nr:hypothetical protein D8771_11655 [Streptomyces albus]
MLGRPPGTLRSGVKTWPHRALFHVKHFTKVLRRRLRETPGNSFHPYQGRTSPLK